MNKQINDRTSTHAHTNKEQTSKQANHYTNKTCIQKYKQTNKRNKLTHTHIYVQVHIYIYIIIFIYIHTLCSKPYTYQISGDGIVESFVARRLGMYVCICIYLFICLFMYICMYVSMYVC